jgi:polar amino acid transport system permease protein/polar amino acid transport system substrate-binding protein
MDKIGLWWADFSAQFYKNFIKSDRWLSLVKGLGATLQITFVALMIGLLIGIVVAAVRSTYDKNKEVMAKKGGLGWFMMRIGNAICNLYLTVFRGTPVVVQLLIFFFVIFAGSRNGLLVASIAFGINSGAYVAEIFRSGIASVDNGQFEAGRSLGFNYIQTMIHIIIPQAFKIVLPTLCNEFIVLLKETSVAGYVGVIDLTKAGDIIRGRTFSAFMPLIAVALVYLVMVVVLTTLVRMLERRLQRSER